MLGVICQERLFQILSLGNKNRKGFYFVFLSLIRIIGMLPKILSLGNKNKKRIFILYSSRLFVSLTCENGKITKTDNKNEKN